MLLLPPASPAALNTFGMKLVAIPEGSDNWQVSDGHRFLKRFENGMVHEAHRLADAL